MAVSTCPPGWHPWRDSTSTTAHVVIPRLTDQAPPDSTSCTAPSRHMSGYDCPRRGSRPHPARWAQRLFSSGQPKSRPWGWRSVPCHRVLRAVRRSVGYPVCITRALVPCSHRSPHSSIPCALRAVPRRRSNLASCACSTGAGLRCLAACRAASVHRHWMPRHRRKLQRRGHDRATPSHQHGPSSARACCRFQTADLVNALLCEAFQGRARNARHWPFPTVGFVI